MGIVERHQRRHERTDQIPSRENRDLQFSGQGEHERERDRDRERERGEGVGGWGEESPHCVCVHVRVEGKLKETKIFNYVGVRSTSWT